MLKKNRFRRLLLGGATLLTALMGVTLANPANALPSISIAVSEDAGLGNLQVLGTWIFGIASPSFVTANFIGSVSATGSPILPQPTLDTSSIDARTANASNGNKTLYIYITERGLTSPTGVSNFLSGFTSNTFTGGATSVEEHTFLSTSNALWTGTALGSQTFTGIGSSSMLNLSPNITGVFSETAQYIIKIHGDGSVNESINMSNPIPESTSMALLGSSLIGIGMIKRRRTARAITA
jgi:hypothetical protein